ncbi:MAG: KEOPS complex kinase/ATPase Bud32 [Nanoarchaeota archaeon]
MKIIKQGAEAILKLDKNILIKERIPKSYRIKQIDDRLRKFRTKREANLLKKAHFLYVPKIFKVDEKKMLIEMEFISGKLLKDSLQKNKNFEVAELIGVEIAKMHDNDIIHGDLTTTNIIIKDNKPYFIDFGLGFISHKVEDKAVDLYLLKQALTSSFPLIADEVFNKILSGYKLSKDFNKVIERLKKVGKRGHYKNAE